MENIHYRRSICFANKKILKSFKNDWFQIIPIDKYLNSELNTNHFPFILEYKIDKTKVTYFSYENVFENYEDSTKNFLSEIQYENDTKNYILKLLSTVSNFYFFDYDIHDHGWFINMDAKDPESIACKYGFKSYFDKDLQKNLHISEFTEVKGPEIEAIEHSRYYTYPDIDNANNGEVKFSQLTKLFFNKIESLQDIQKKYFDSAITLIYNGQKIRQTMKSLSFIAFISSIEAMTSLEGKMNKEEIEFECNSCKRIKSSNYTCKTCNKPIWGISQQIKLYLEKYLTSQEKLKTVIII